MAHKVKKMLIATALMSGLFMAISACNLNLVPSSSSFENSSSENSSSSESSSSSSSSSSEPEPVVTLESITVTNNKDSYEWGEDLDIDVFAHYSDESSTQVNDYTVSGFNKEQSGEQTVTVTYQGETFTFTVTVNNPTLTNITVTGNKDTYNWGEDLNINVIAHYSNNTTENVDDYKVEGYNPKTPGQQTVIVTYQGETYTFTVTVKDPALINITVTNNKDSYEWGENLDITVYAYYEDGTKVEVTDYTVSGFDSKKSGSQNITVTYGDKNTSFRVNVNERKNLFPTDKMNSFIYDEGIQTNVPAPTGYETWTYVTNEKMDGRKTFTLTTKDTETGNNTIAAQYAQTLLGNGWDVDFTGTVYTAEKDPKDVNLSFSTANSKFTLTLDSYSLFPNKGYSGELVKTSSSLKDGDKVILGSLSEQCVVTGLENGSLVSSPCSVVNDNIASIANNVVRLTLKKANGLWNLIDNEGRKLGANGINSLVWDKGSVDWTIIMSDGSAIILNEVRDYGRLYFNPDNGSISSFRFTSGTNLIYPQIFRLVETSIIYPTSISITGSQKIAIDRKGTLSIKYTPDNANALNEVVWDSSNKSVATIDNNGAITPVSLGTTTITAKTVSRNETLTATYEVEVSESVPNRWTILIYMCGADLESGSGLASMDLDEILSVDNQPDDMNIVIETGGSKKWKKYNIDAKALSRYHVENKSLVLDEKLAKDNMGKQSTLESFLNWGLDAYPAEKTGVVFWNHGGALGGCCSDENYGGDSLLNSETSAAFKNVFEKNNIDKLEFVGYDCCLMQVQDIAEFNSHYFNYMVGSEEAEDGYGWDYENWIDDLYAGKDTRAVLKANCDSFVTSCGLNSDQTLSYLDLSKMEDYYTKFEALSAAIKSTVQNNYSSFKSLLGTVKSFGDYYTSGLKSYGTIDGYDFLNKLGSNSKYSSFKNQIDEVKAAYKSLVVYSKVGTGAGNANGLIVIAAAYVSYPASETRFTNWRSLYY